MTALYLYAITDDSEAFVSSKTGLKDALPFSIRYQDIAAVVSPLAVNEVPATEANLWKHEGVIEDLMADRAVLPARFGTVIPDEAAIHRVLATHYANFVATLGRVRGRVELGLRVLWTNQQPAPVLSEGERTNDIPHSSSIASPGPLTGSGHRVRRSASSSGRSYLLARVEEERQHRAWRKQAEALAAELHASLARLVTASIRQVLLTPRLLLTAAYLIKRDDVEAFKREVGVLSAAHPTLRFLCTGPWPPYNFVSATTETIVEE